MALITTIVLMDGSDGRTVPSSWVTRGEMGAYVTPDQRDPDSDRQLVEEFYPWTSVLCTRQYRVPDQVGQDVPNHVTVGHRIV